MSWALVVMIGIAGTVASFNRVQFSRRVALEMREVAAGAAEAAPSTQERSDLPAPVARYIDSTVTIANSSGPQLDQGALLRLLGEMTWMPTALVDRRYVHWSAIDDHRASATLSINGREVTGVFEFGADDLPMAFTAERYRDVGGGKSVLTSFIGRSSDYRPVSGVLVPFRVVGAWVIENRPIDYADFAIEEGYLPL